MLFKLFVEPFKKQVIIMAIAMTLFVYLVNLCFGLKKNNPNQTQTSVPSPKILLHRDMEISPSLPNL